MAGHTDDRDPDDLARRAEIIDRLYDVALEPSRYEALLDSWERRMGPHRGAGVDGAQGYSDTELETHFRRADAFLDRVDGPADPRDALLAEFPNSAAFTVEADLRIGRANDLAVRALGIAPGARCEELDRPDDVDGSDLHRAIGAGFASGGPTTMMLRLPAEDDRTLLLQVRMVRGADPFALVVSSELGWPAALDRTLQEAFGLSAAEIDVVKGLVTSRSVREIAAERKRSVETIRTQIKAILQKTETRGQAELVRVCLSLMDIVSVTEDAHRASSAAAPASTGVLEPRHPIVLTRPDGRRSDHLVLGDPNGRAVLYFPVDYGLVRWTAEAEAEAERRGLRVIVPIRAGYGHSTGLPAGTDPTEHAVGDAIAALDHHGAGAAPIISFGTDSYFAHALASRHPGRVSALILAGGGLPFLNAAQYERMHKWHRFIIANARYAPRMLPFMVKAGFSLARRIGKVGFLRAVHGDCPGDLELFDRPDVREAMITGSEVSLSADHSAHVAFANECVAQQRDWSDMVRAASDVPTVFFSGRQDPMAPPATLEEWREAFPSIDFRSCPEAGGLVFFSRWREIVELADGYAGRA